MEPIPVSPPAPFQPPGNWLVRSWIALWQQHRLPTRLMRGWDRFCAGCGLRTRRLRAGGLQFRVRRLTADEDFVREVLVDRQYTPRGDEINAADTVIDVGGNIGAFALLAAALAPRGRIITVEPASENFRMLQRNIRLNGFRQITAVPAAVLAESRPATLYLSAEGTGSHSVRAALAGASARSETVDGLCLAELFARFAIADCHFLKLDCEGAEFDILQTLPEECYRRIGRMALEYHTTTIAAKRAEADGLVAELQRHGFAVERYTDEVGTNRGMIHARRGPPAGSR